MREMSFLAWKKFSETFDYLLTKAFHIYFHFIANLYSLIILLRLILDFVLVFMLLLSKYIQNAS